MIINNVIAKHSPEFYGSLQQAQKKLNDSVGFLKVKGGHKPITKILRSMVDAAIYALAIAVHYTAYPIILGIVFVRNSREKYLTRKLVDCERLFQSPVFSSYQKQLKSFVKEQIDHDPNLGMLYRKELNENPILEKGRELLAFLMKNPGQSASSKRAYHQNMVNKLREFIVLSDKWKSNQDPVSISLVQFVDKLNAWKYQDLKLLDSMEEFVSKVAGIKLTPEQTSFEDSIDEIILDSYGKLVKQKKYSGNDEKTGRIYDPYLLGDTPSFLFPLNEKTGVMRTAVATRDLERDPITQGLKSAMVTEECSKYLETHSNLYVNLMARRYGSQRIRSCAIEKQEELPAYKNTAFVATLDKDSSFYWQLHPYFNMDDAKAFKEKFLERMFLPADTSDYYWPKALDESAWKEECQIICDNVHQAFSPGKEALTRQERLDFIELVYADIIYALADILGPSTMNLTCLSCIDRGATALSLLYMHKLKREKVILDPDQVKKTIALALGPAVLAQNRPPEKGRVDRLSSAAKRLFAI